MSMKNKKINILSNILFLLLICINVNASEQFNFDVTEIEISENGNKFVGKKRGTISTNNGIIIKANEFIMKK